MSERMIIENISFRYGHRYSPRIFEGLSFSLSRGEMLCLLGPNGTGKSTLLKCMIGLLKPLSGSILLDGENIAALSREGIAKKVGFVPQSHSSVFPFRVRDVVVMGRTPHLNIFSSPSREDLRLAEEIMESVGIVHLANKPCTMISGGEWQLVMIARALTQRPEILLLDEPTSHLDMGNQLRILSVVHTLSRSGMTVVMASHFPDHAFLSANRVAILKEGAFAALGLPDSVITEASLKSTYGVRVKVLHIEEAGRKACVPVMSLQTGS